jgi:hypothetical protein
MFETAGMPRNQRSIERYCNDQKLDCFFESDEQRYYISPGSVERLVAQLREIRARHEASPDVVIGPTASDTVRPAPTPAPAPVEDPQLERKIKELEDKLFNLEVERRAKEQVVNMLRDQIKDDRSEYHKQLSSITTQLVDQSRQIGTLETKLKQIEAPKARSAAADVSTTPPTTDSVPDIRTVSSAATSAAPPPRIVEVPVEEIPETKGNEQV